MVRTDYYNYLALKVQLDVLPEDDDDDDGKDYPYWYIGVPLFALGGVLFVVAYKWSAASQAREADSHEGRKKSNDNLTPQDCFVACTPHLPTVPPQVFFVQEFVHGRYGTQKNHQGRISRSSDETDGWISVLSGRCFLEAHRLMCFIEICHFNLFGEIVPVGAGECLPPACIQRDAFSRVALSNCCFRRG